MADTSSSVCTWARVVSLEAEELVDLGEYWQEPASSFLCPGGWRVGGGRSAGAGAWAGARVQLPVPGWVASTVVVWVVPVKNQTFPTFPHKGVLGGLCRLAAVMRSQVRVPRLGPQAAQVGVQVGGHTWFVVPAWYGALRWWSASLQRSV